VNGVGARAQSESYAERTQKSSPPNLIDPELAAMGKKGVEEFANAQRELLTMLQETNRQWLDRMQSEAKLASEFAMKVMATHSIPDAMTACQEWTSRRFEMMAEDGKHLFADVQKIMETGTRLLSSGWHGNGRGGVST
jgi:hypothetical protein